MDGQRATGIDLWPAFILAEWLVRTEDCPKVLKEFAVEFLTRAVERWQHVIQRAAELAGWEHVIAYFESRAQTLQQALVRLEAEDASKCPGLK